MRRNQLSAILLLVLAACAPQMERVATAASTVVPVAQERPIWAIETSDILPDPAFRFGRLENGMRFVIRHNATPKGTALVRMEVAAGSLDEADSERGFAHFVEHMAFNGSTRVPEGEMIRLLERKGLAFGADTNAQTTFNRTTYLLDLPRNDPELLDTALMLMRETASELSFAQSAVDRERGVIQAERRDRNTYLLRNLQAQINFVHPGSRFAARFPIGTEETIEGATGESLRTFWSREYVPSQTTVIVVGDFETDAAEAAIRKHFADWKPASANPLPSSGPILPQDKGRTAIYLDPALSERVFATRNGQWLHEPDSVATREENILRQIGYDVINRRFQRLSRSDDPPFRDAGFGTGEVFRDGRSTNLVIDTVDGKWRRGLIAAVAEYRKAITFGFAPSEIAEQVANLRTAVQNLSASADTRSHSDLLESVFGLLRDDRIPTTPQSGLARLESLIPRITPDSVLAALTREAVPLADPLLRFHGRKAPEGGERAIRAAWDKAMRQTLKRDTTDAKADFAYDDFGPAGVVAFDSREVDLGIRQVRFANGVMLNLRRTDIEKDKVYVQVSIDGGDFLNTKQSPLAAAMAGSLGQGGLGKHSLDQLETILAGRTVGMNLTSTAETFVAQSQTTPRDLELQLQLLTALITDPGYRKEGEVRYRQSINNFFAQLRATPQATLQNSLGGILSDNDPRFTLQPIEAYRKLSFIGLKQAIADRLAHGAIEIGLVGDFDEDQAIALVGKTLGALPNRELAFGTWESQRQRPFTMDRSPRVIHHAGVSDQALLRYSWPTRDDADQAEALALKLLERVVRIELTETLREKLGKAYSPSASSFLSRTWRGYGTFSLTASIDVREVSATRAAIAETIAALRQAPVDADILQRARQPLIEAHDNALKSNAGWMALVDRAQSEVDRIARHGRERDLLLAVTAKELQLLAQRYLQSKDGVEVLVLPEGQKSVNP